MAEVDIMDGNFVPNISIGLPIVSAISSIASKPLDVHLMIVNPDRYIDDFIEAGSFAKAKELGKWRLEGKEYIVKDGDIISVRHS